jgi:hypothetical protein
MKDAFAGHFQSDVNKRVVRIECWYRSCIPYERCRCVRSTVTLSMKNLLKAFVFAALSVTYLISSPIAEEQAQMQVRKALVNQDIVLMVKNRFADSTIIKLIRANETQFDVSVPAVVQLKSVGVSQGVIETMIAASTTKPVVASATPIARPTPVAGGVVKQNLTLGWDKGHINGTIRGSHSQLDLTSASGAGGVLEFVVRCPEGDAASEYQLIHFWVKGDRREFRTVTGGVFHASGGAQDNVVDFKYEKVAARTYKIELRSPGAGEYGFLAPGTTASLNAASQGKMYTFSLAE